METTTTTETTKILEQLVALDQDVKASKPASRENMLVAAQALVTSLQTPSEFISSVAWAEPARFACVRTALDLNIFEILAKGATEAGLSAAQIAKESGADEALVARILRHLAAMTVLMEPSQGLFTNTALSTQLTRSEYRDGILYCYDVAGPSFSQLPAYLRKTGFKQPLNPVDGPFQFAHNTQGHFFAWLGENPTYLAAFANYMGGYRQGKQPWFAETFYPVQTQLLNGFNTDDAAGVEKDESAFLVDVGGGKGHDLLALQAAFSASIDPNSLILQDIPDVIDNLEALVVPAGPAGSASGGTIKTMSHDFFTPQPIKGARAYFLHSVLHDWDDDKCIQILRNIKSAMTPKYSKVLVHDLIVPDRGATWGVTSMDWLMMALGSVRERTESDFRRLFDAAGLKVEKVWIYEQGTEGIIEAVVDG